jgi:6-phosphogluconolactonase
MNTTRRNMFKVIGFVFALSSVSLSALADDDDDDASFRADKVFVSTNATTNNELLVFAVGSGGKLSLQTRVPTQGQGTGGGLGNQGAVTMSLNERFLFVVNAASNSVSTFAIRRDGVTLRSTVASGGLRPVSVAEHGGIVYVLNAGGTGNVAGFRNVRGELRPIADSVRSLSAASGTNAAQVGFSNDGDVLVLTEKGTNKLTTYRVRHDGSIGAPEVTASAGQTPFGFAFDRRDNLLVSEAFGGAVNGSAVTSYGFDYRAPTKPNVISASIGTTQTAACWVVVTPNGRYAYVTNTGSNTISSYAIQKSGQLSLEKGIAATTGDGPIDAYIPSSGSYLFVLNSRSQTISSFTIGRDGSLSNPSTVGGLPAGANGLSAN